MKQNKIKILVLKILTVKIENPVDEYNNKLGPAGEKKESVNWRGTSKEITKRKSTDK